MKSARIVGCVYHRSWDVFLKGGKIRSTTNPHLNNWRSSQTRAYRVAFCTEYGKPLVIRDVERKDIKSGQARVKIHAAGVNFADLLFAKGLYQVKLDLPFTSGLEFSGTVLETAENSEWNVGDRICGMNFATAHAEEAVVDETILFKIPDEIDFVAAAGFIASYATALFSIKFKSQLKEGETLLVTSATGALGLAIVDLAQNVYGAKVIGAAGGAEKCAFLETKGIKAIDYNNESVKDAVKQIQPKGVDVVIDSMGGDIFMQCFKSLAVDGRLLSLGFTSGKFPSLPVNHMMVKNATVMGVNWGTYKDYNRKFYRSQMEEALNLFKDGKVNPYIGSTFKLNQINEAFTSIANRKTIGKVVIEIQ